LHYLNGPAIEFPIEVESGFMMENAIEIMGPQLKNLMELKNGGIIDK
jgi:hypothetical protein